MPRTRRTSPDRPRLNPICLFKFWARAFRIFVHATFVRLTAPADRPMLAFPTILARLRGKDRSMRLALAVEEVGTAAGLGALAAVCAPGFEPINGVPK